MRAGRARVFERAIVSVEAAAAARALAPAEAHEAEETKLEFLFDDFGGDVATLFCEGRQLLSALTLRRARAGGEGALRGLEKTREDARSMGYDIECES